MQYQKIRDRENNTYYFYIGSSRTHGLCLSS